jgi:hypothetical protein
MIYIHTHIYTHIVFNAWWENQRFENPQDRLVEFPVHMHTYTRTCIVRKPTLWKSSRSLGGVPRTHVYIHTHMYSEKTSEETNALKIPKINWRKLRTNVYTYTYTHAHTRIIYAYSHTHTQIVLYSIPENFMKFALQAELFKDSDSDSYWRRAERVRLRFRQLLKKSWACKTQIQTEELLERWDVFMLVCYVLDTGLP